MHELAFPLLVGLIFWFIMRSVIHADSNERKAYAQVEAAELTLLVSARGGTTSLSDYVFVA